MIEADTKLRNWYCYGTVHFLMLLIIWMLRQCVANVLYSSNKDYTDYEGKGLLTAYIEQTRRSGSKRLV